MPGPLCPVTRTASLCSCSGLRIPAPGSLAPGAHRRSFLPVSQPPLLRAPKSLSHNLGFRCSLSTFPSLPTSHSPPRSQGHGWFSLPTRLTWRSLEPIIWRLEGRTVTSRTPQFRFSKRCPFDWESKATPGGWTATTRPGATNGLPITARHSQNRWPEAGVQQELGTLVPPTAQHSLTATPWTRTSEQSSVGNDRGPSLNRRRRNLGVAVTGFSR